MHYLSRRILFLCCCAVYTLGGCSGDSSSELDALADASMVGEDAGGLLDDGGQPVDTDAGLDPCENGGCIETCDTTTLICGPNSQCLDIENMTPVCECDSGYQDNDGDGQCTADCSTFLPSCGNFSVCSDLDGTAVCSCDNGYQDNDGDGQCTANCSTFLPSCGNFSVCSDLNGTAVCSCDSGYQDNDGNGQCSVSCTTLLPTCGNFSICSDLNGTAACSCPAGSHYGTDGNCYLNIADLLAFGAFCQLTSFNSFCQVSIRNQGTAIANNLLVDMRLRASSINPSPNLLIGSCTIGSLVPGETKTLTCPVSGFMNALAPGNNTIRVTANPNLAINEIATINNYSDYNYFYFP